MVRKRAKTGDLSELRPAREQLKIALAKQIRKDRGVTATLANKVWEEYGIGEQNGNILIYHSHKRTGERMLIRNDTPIRKTQKPRTWSIAYYKYNPYRLN